MESTSQVPPTSITSPPKVPGKKSVFLFLAAIGIAILLVIGAVVAAVYQAGQSDASANRAWCQALELLTATPQTAPTDPSKNPSRVFAYDLYQDFRSIEIKFGC
jgi:hypothetical protein